ncbi:MAG: DVUA0089 family protein [Myxococcota bacterium]
MASSHRGFGTRASARSALAMFAGCLLLAVWLPATAARAETPCTTGACSFSGQFVQDDDIVLLEFEVASGPDKVVTVRTTSYGGNDCPEVDAAGTPMPSGGFDPILSLFDATGARLAENDDGFFDVCEAPNGEQFDASMELQLAAGIHRVALTQNDSHAGVTLWDPFSREGQGNFTADFGCGESAFCDQLGNRRTPDWSLDVLGADSVTFLPEPSPDALAGLAFATVVLLGSLRAPSARLQTVRSRPRA